MESVRDSHRKTYTVDDFTTTKIYVLVEEETEIEALEQEGWKQL